MQAQIEEGILVQTNNTRRMKLKKVNVEENRKKFSKILDRCISIFVCTATSGGDIFDLLDPLISDTQCHVHAVLILNVLRKCYEDDDFDYQRLSNLGETDKRILSYAVLFSLLKIEYKDIFGAIIRQVSIIDFDGLVFSAKKRERHHIFEAKRNFNRYSVEFMKNVGSKKIREIFDECEAAKQQLELKLLPHYASIYAVIDYIEEKKWPLIVSLVSINRRIVDGGSEYNIIHKDVRFYECGEDGNRFRHKKHPSDREKNLPTIACLSYSLVNNGVQEFPLDYSIRDLIMLNFTNHVQLPTNNAIPFGHEDGESYLKKLYAKHPDLHADFQKSYSFAKKHNLIDARFSWLSVEHTDEKTSLIIERRKEDGILLLDHVYVSNYSRECQRLKSFDETGIVNEREAFDFDTKKDALEVLKRIAMQLTV